MGTVHAEITIKNSTDVTGLFEGRLKEHEVRSVTVNSVVDTGATSLVINEELRNKLGLGVIEERYMKLADGGKVLSRITTPVSIHWKNRSWVCPAVSLEHVEHILLGAIPLEGMDLMVNPKTQELSGVHGDVIEMLLLNLEPYTERVSA